MSSVPAVHLPIHRHSGGRQAEDVDAIAVEAALEILAGEPPEPLSITMRTPGHDRELVTGYLFAEGLIDSLEGITGFEVDSPSRVRVKLAGPARDLRGQSRHSYVSSSCGVCGKTSIGSIAEAAVVGSDDLTVPDSVLRRLPQELMTAQKIFGQTGGLHASALFSQKGRLIALYEDVGRHNALDKLIGATLIRNRDDLARSVLLVSGRVSFELVQKTARAGIPIMAAIGAPSSLAIETAERAGITVVGFLRPDRFNVYTRARRILIDS